MFAKRVLMVLMAGSLGVAMSVQSGEPVEEEAGEQAAETTAEGTAAGTSEPAATEPEPEEPQPAEPPPEPETRPAPPPVTGTADNVHRARFTSEMVDREPTDVVEEATTATETIYFFTEIRGMEGGTIVHRWKHGGEVQAEVDFDIGGPRWRVWSSKDMIDAWTGEWTVEVVDGAGNVLTSKSFTYTEPETAVEQPAEETDTGEGRNESGDTGKEKENEKEPMDVTESDDIR